MQQYTGRQSYCHQHYHLSLSPHHDEGSDTSLWIKYSLKIYSFRRPWGLHYQQECTNLYCVSLFLAKCRGSTCLKTVRSSIHFNFVSWSPLSGREEARCLQPASQQLSAFERDISSSTPEFSWTGSRRSKCTMMVVLQSRPIFPDKILKRWGRAFICQSALTLEVSVQERDDSYLERRLCLNYLPILSHLWYSFPICHLTTLNAISHFARTLN